MHRAQNETLFLGIDALKKGEKDLTSMFNKAALTRRPLIRLSAVETLEDRRLFAVGAGVESVAVMWDGQEHQARPNSWLVGLNNVHGNAADQRGQANALLAKAGKGLQVGRHLGNDGIFQVDAPAGTKPAELRAAMAKLQSVSFFEPDFVLSAQATPNDPHYGGYAWALNNTAQTGGTVDADIDAPEAWELAKGDGSVVVGVIDSGVDYSHPDLAGNIWTNPGEVAGDGVDNDVNGYVDDVHGWDFFNRDNNPMDDNGHGTHVAGTIAASGNNGTGVTGVNWNAEVVPLKFMGADGSGYLSDAVSAINYANSLRTKGVNLRVTNNSWGGGGYSSALFDAIKRSSDAGIMFVAAAGNSALNNDATLSYPGSYNLPNVISVAATDHNDALASFSNYGATQVDLAAPGVNILSTVPGGYGYMSGTSMAAPHVAGAAALAWAHSPSATVQGVRDAILAGSDKVASLSGKVATGARLNLFNTLSRIGFGVASSDPSAGQSLTSRPLDFTVNFSNAYAASSVQASDLKVNGVAASSVSFTDADTVTFRYASSPVTATSGTQTMQIASGAISGLSGTGVSAWSSTFAYEAPAVVAIAPAAPASLMARSLSRSQISLTWQDRSSDEIGFKVERSSDGGKTFTEIGSVGADVTGATVTGLSSNRTYHFRVRAYNAAGHSTYSNVASAKTSR